MLRKLLIITSVLVVILGGTFLYFKQPIMDTVHFAKQTKETAATVNQVNKKLPDLIQQAKQERANEAASSTTSSLKSTSKSTSKANKAAEKEIKQQLVTVKQELNKLVQTEPPAKLKSLHDELAANSDEANRQIDNYIQQIDNGTFDPEQFEALYEQMKDTPEFKEAEKYLNLLK
ncbi:hypothetical protein A8990_10779 [Paenibacillus taihuensis]|uniref:Uncharacterized protein n=1 Tax=Paenibacillus taihuensis TaxID=1156355 RepID=A0A3D9SFP4_9BACL|nr:DUF6376 family protein [Paenibacillus taihuensis]REE88983.1 hypothetical protein A8990_10779 [Paenibacillus taihuensis]